MKRNNITHTIVYSLLVLLVFNACSQKQNEDKAEQISPEEMRSRGEAMMKAIMPGEEHKQFKQLEGTWSFRCTMQGNKDTTSIFAGSGKTTNKLILNGRFLHSESAKSDSLPLSVGLFILGFDRGLNKYTTTIFGEGGTNYVTTLGEMSKTKNQIHTSGSNYNPILKVKEDYDVDIELLSKNNYRIVLSFKDKFAKSTMSSLTIDFLRTEVAATGTN
jgi:hypothetical protein